MGTVQVIAILSIMLIASFGIWIWIVAKRRQVDTRSAGKIMGVMFTTTGKTLRVWAKYDGQVCYLKLENGKLIAVNPPNQMDTRTSEKRQKEIRGVLTSGMYYFDSNCIVKEQWPYTSGVMAALFSREVGHVYWFEGMTEPISNRNLPQILQKTQEISALPEYEDDLRRVGLVMTPGLVTAKCNEGSTQIVAGMEEQNRELQEQTIVMARKYVNPIFVYLMGILAIGGMVTAIVFAIMSQGKLDELMKALGV